MLLKQAETIAVATCYKLQPYCTKINIAGSIRRKKKEVKDIEIICLPKSEKSKDLFGGEGEIIRSKKFIETVNSLGKIIKGNASGKMIQIELPEGINLDLFVPDDFDYYRQYAIRTGSADYAHKVIAAGWKKQGWCGSDKGLRRMTDCNKMLTADGQYKWICFRKDAVLPPVWQSEEEFFKWIRVPFEKPLHRL